MAESQGREHDYHLVDPSPLPIMGAISAFVLALGFIMFMNNNDYSEVMAKAGPWVFAIGGIMLAYTAFVWWREVARESEIYHTPIVRHGLRYGMALFIASEVMFFMAWFWAFFNASIFPTEFIGGVWPPKDIEVLDPWDLPLINTLILVTSSFTVTYAHHAIKHGDQKGLVGWLAVTIVLGLTFTAIQGYEYLHATYTIDQNIYGSTFYMATGFHGVHVIIGTIFLIVCLVRARLGQFQPDHHFGLEAAAWYWHFVDVVWIFLFSCVYIWGSGISLFG